MVRGRIYRFESLSLDVGVRHLPHHRKAVHLTPKEFDLLALLFENAGRVVTKDEILCSVWRGAAVEEGNLTQTISLLRKVIGGEGDEDPIETVPRHGYLFRAKVKSGERLFALKPVRRAFPMKAGAMALFLVLWALLFYWFGARR